MPRIHKEHHPSYLDKEFKRRELFAQLFAALSNIGDGRNPESDESRSMVLAMIHKMEEDSNYGADAKWTDVDDLADKLQNSPLLKPFKGAKYDASQDAVIEATKGRNSSYPDETKENKDQYRSAVVSGGLGISLAVAAAVIISVVSLGLFAIIPLALAGLAGVVWAGHKSEKLREIDHKHKDLETRKEDGYHKAIKDIAAQPDSSLSSTGQLMQELGERRVSETTLATPATTAHAASVPTAPDTVVQPVPEVGSPDQDPTEGVSPRF